MIAAGDVPDSVKKLLNQNRNKIVSLGVNFSNMASKAFETEFLKNLDLLSKEQQNKVITYIQTLLKRSKTNNHQTLLKFAGTLNAKEAQEIGSAIEAGCENIDRNEW